MKNLELLLSSGKDIIQNISTMSDDDLGVLAEYINDTFDKADIQTNHYFHAGIYIREMVVPANCFVIGQAHTSGDFTNILTQGSALLRNEEGEIMEVTAPYISNAKNGNRKTAYFTSDSKWINIHNTDKTTVKEVEKDILVPESPLFKTRYEYIKAIKDIGFTHEQVQSITQQHQDLICIDMSLFGVEVQSSPIDGMGLFTTKDFKQGDVICPTRICDFRTEAGRYTNHSDFPNVESKLLDGQSVHYIALKDLLVGDEILVDYREAYKLLREMEK
jgi:hypothetical protein